MLKVLYLDCFLGFECEMLLGALIDAGADRDYIENGLKKIFATARIKTDEVKRCSIEALRAEIEVEQKTFGKKEFQELSDSGIFEQSLFSAFCKIISEECEDDYKVSSYEICKAYSLFLALKSIEADYVICSPICLGSGFKTLGDGYEIIPSDKILSLAKNRGILCKRAEVQGELTEWFDALVLVSIAKEYAGMPKMEIEKIGYGAGEENLSEPNLLRTVLGNFGEGETYSIFESRDLFSEDMGIFV